MLPTGVDLYAILTPTSNSFQYVWRITKSNRPGCLYIVDRWNAIHTQYVVYNLVRNSRLAMLVKNCFTFIKENKKNCLREEKPPYYLVYVFSILRVFFILRPDQIFNSRNLANTILPNMVAHHRLVRRLSRYYFRKAGLHKVALVKVPLPLQHQYSSQSLQFQLWGSDRHISRVYPFLWLFFFFTP